MEFSSIPKMYKMIGAAVALSVIAVPVIVRADSSNPVYTPKKKAAMKPRAKKKAVARRPMARPAPRPAPAEPMVESIAPPAPEPQYVPPPAPEYVPPAPQPAPTPAPAAAPVAKSGGNGLLLGLLGAAAVAGGILLATSGDNSPASGG
jgi:hypothetical protein